MDGSESQTKRYDCAVRSGLRQQGIRGFNMYAAHVITKPRGMAVSQQPFNKTAIVDAHVHVT